LSARIVQLAEIRTRPPGWSPAELAHLHHAAHVLRASGVFLETDSGTTDEREPWFVFCDAESGEVVAHIARVTGKFVVCAPLDGGSLTGRVFSDLAQRFLERCPDEREVLEQPLHTGHVTDPSRHPIPKRGTQKQFRGRRKQENRS
jgi:hypothetical protein